MTLSYDAIRNGLVHKGVPREIAERTAREQTGIRIPTEAELKAEDAREKEEQSEVVDLFRAFRFKVRNLSQARPSKQAPGLPDLWCVHEELPIAFWWETKRTVRGTYSDAQLEFAADCRRCGVGHGSGDRLAARSHLIALGLAQVVGDTLEPVRRSEARTLAHCAARQSHLARSSERPGEQT